MNQILIEREWERSEFPKPDVLSLQTANKKFAVVEDSTTVVFVVSKTEIVYAIPKNKLVLFKDENGDDYYYTEEADNLKIVSCTRETIEKRHKRQFFVLTKIIKYL
jgi:hypothetical protein